MEITIGRQGNQKMPITDLTVSKRHCLITDNGDGTFTLENLSQFGTEVNGVPVIKTTVTPQCIIRMGNITASVAQLLGLDGSVQQKHRHQGGTSRKEEDDKPAYNIAHLERIWNDYNQKNIEIAKKQQKINLTRTGLGICTMCTMPLYLVMGPAAYILTGVAVVGNIFSFVGMKNVDSPEQRQMRQDEFDNAWVCPNPECNRTLLAKNYNMLVKNHKFCPYCKCKYVVK